MMSLKELQDNIEVVRELLTYTIQVKESLLDPEIVYMSKLLDKLLNDYNRLNKSMK
jgi:hypothetical protein